jgi:uncharacterized protein YjbI with pentapeptide repeats
MEEMYKDGEDYHHVDFKEVPLMKGEYENCSFTACNFFEADLSGIIFSDCKFSGCDLSMAVVSEAAFRDIAFENCKMLGIRFDEGNQFGLAFRFEGCILDNSSFYQTKIKKTVFRNTQLRSVDFVDCNLTSALFDNCDLSGAIFENTILEKADLRSSNNYVIDPEFNRIKKASFSLSGIPGLLQKYGISIDASL